MLSRIAESLYWIGRYVERAEDTARITDVKFHHTLGMGATPEDEARRQRQWESLLAIVGDNRRFLATNAVANDETVPEYLIMDRSNPNSVISCVARARELAGGMRHQVASEMWEAINRFHLRLQGRSDQADGIAIVNPHLFFRSVVEFSHLFQGVTDSTMPREEGWYFLQAGKFLERAEKTARALDVNFQLLLVDTSGPEPLVGPRLEDVPGEPHRWLALMRSLSAYEAYHKLYRSAVRPRSVIEMLILSPLFPRSIRFSIGEVEAALAAIAGARPDDGGGFIPGQLPWMQAGHHGQAERAIGRLRSQLSYSTVDEVFQAGVHQYLLSIERTCHEVGEHIQRQYFSPRVLTPEECIA